MLPEFLNPSEGERSSWRPAPGSSVSAVWAHPRLQQQAVHELQSSKSLLIVLLSYGCYGLFPSGLLLCVASSLSLEAFSHTCEFALLSATPILPCLFDSIVMFGSQYASRICCSSSLRR